MRAVGHYGRGYKSRVGCCLKKVSQFQNVIGAVEKPALLAARILSWLMNAARKAEPIHNAAVGWGFTNRHLPTTRLCNHPPDDRLADTDIGAFDRYWQSQVAGADGFNSSSQNGLIKDSRRAVRESQIPGQDACLRAPMGCPQV
jgi:hypothetical protein